MQEGKTKNIGHAVFAVLFMAICLVPFVGMVWTTDDMTSDGSNLASMPEFIEENGALNINYFQELGIYFEDHFAYRNEAIDANAHIRAGIFATSPTDQVIIGTDGWLYYGGTLSDFLGENALTEREAKNIAHNLSLVQGYVNAQGSEFIFTIAPNKNSLYPDHMPYYYIEGKNENMALLKTCLDEKGVNYIDLFDLFESQDEVLYARTDTHWDSKGALLVTNAILEACEKSASVPHGDPEITEFVGDIEKMLYPSTAQPEETLNFNTGTWVFEGGAESVEDAYIQTSSKGEGTFLMYRDSFANNLIPYIAPEFEDAYFSKLVPYNLTQIIDLNPSVVVVERAERHVDYLAKTAPFMFAPTVVMSYQNVVESESMARWYEDGDFRVLEGFIDDTCIDIDDNIFVQVENTSGNIDVYVPFHVTWSDLESATSEDASGNKASNITTDFGFRLYLDESSLTEDTYTITVLVSKADSNEVRAVHKEVLQR